MPPRRGVLCPDAIQRSATDFAERDDILAGDAIEVIAALPAEADHGDVEFAVEVPSAQQGWGSQADHAAERSCMGEKATAAPACRGGINEASKRGTGGGFGFHAPG